ALTFLAEMDDINDDMFTDALIIVCDTANTGRISDARYKLGKQIIKIDHHPNVDPYGDIMWVDTTASSTSEMIYELFLFGQGEWKLSEHGAKLIYAGIVGDTGRFLFQIGRASCRERCRKWCETRLLNNEKRMVHEVSARKNCTERGD